MNIWNRKIHNLFNKYVIHEIIFNSSFNLQFSLLPGNLTQQPNPSNVSKTERNIEGWNCNKLTHLMVFGSASEFSARADSRAAQQRQTKFCSTKISYEQSIHTIEFRRKIFPLAAPSAEFWTFWYLFFHIPNEHCIYALWKFAFWENRKCWMILESLKYSVSV